MAAFQVGEMYPESVRYRRAQSLAEAVELLEAHGPDARLLAGGQSLVPLMKFRLAVPDVLVDISHISPDVPVQYDGDTARIHALATHREIGEHDGLVSTFDIIGDAIPLLADPQVRTMGTIGGALAEADPSGDWGPLLIATNGTVNTISPTGTRSIPASALFTGPFQTDLGPAEIIESIEIPIPESTAGGAYLKVKRRQGVYATATVGVHVEFDDDERCTAIGVACSAVEPTYANPKVGDVFDGNRITKDRIDQAARLLTETLDPVGDSHASAGFKRNVCGKLFTRGLRAADRRAWGQDGSVDPMGAA